MVRYYLKVAKAINQALGKISQESKDYGAIFLID